MNEAKNIQEPTKKAWSIGVVSGILFFNYYKQMKLHMIKYYM